MSTPSKRFLRQGELTVVRVQCVHGETVRRPVRSHGVVRSSTFFVEARRARVPKAVFWITAIASTHTYEPTCHRWAAIRRTTPPCGKPSIVRVGMVVFSGWCVAGWCVAACVWLHVRGGVGLPTQQAVPLTPLRRNGFALTRTSGGTARPSSSSSRGATSQYAFFGGNQRRVIKPPTSYAHRRAIAAAKAAKAAGEVTFLTPSGGNTPTRSLSPPSLRPNTAGSMLSGGGGGGFARGATTSAGALPSSQRRPLHSPYFGGVPTSPIVAFSASASASARRGVVPITYTPLHTSDGFPPRSGLARAGGGGGGPPASAEEVEALYEQCFALSRRLADMEQTVRNATALSAQPCAVHAHAHDHALGLLHHGGGHGQGGLLNNASLRPTTGALFGRATPAADAATLRRQARSRRRDVMLKKRHARRAAARAAGDGDGDDNSGDGSGGGGGGGGGGGHSLMDDAEKEREWGLGVHSAVVKKAAAAALKPMQVGERVWKEPMSSGCPRWLGDCVVVLGTLPCGVSCSKTLALYVASRTHAWCYC